MKAKKLTSEYLLLVEEASLIKIIPTGWDDLYHVLEEDGETMETNYQLMNSKEINDVFQVDMNEIEN